MLETTTIIIETGTVVGTTGTTLKTATTQEKNEKGEVTALLVDKKKFALGTTLGTAVSVGANSLQEASLRHTLDQVRTAQSYVESMSDEELEKTLMALNELELPTNDNPKTYTK